MTASSNEGRPRLAPRPDGDLVCMAILFFYTKQTPKPQDTRCHSCNLFIRGRAGPTGLVAGSEAGTGPTSWRPRVGANYSELEHVLKTKVLLGTTSTATPLHATRYAVSYTSKK